MLHQHGEMSPAVGHDDSRTGQVGNLGDMRIENAAAGHAFPDRGFKVPVLLVEELERSLMTGSVDDR